MNRLERLFGADGADPTGAPGEIVRVGRGRTIETLNVGPTEVPQTSEPDFGYGPGRFVPVASSPEPEPPVAGGQGRDASDVPTYAMVGCAVFAAGLLLLAIAALAWFAHD